MPPIGGAVHLTFEAVDVRYPVLAVTMFVGNGHRVVLRSQEAELSKARGAVVSLCAFSWIEVFACVGR